MTCAVFKSSATAKRYITIEPDGTCWAPAPDVKDDPVGTNEHWKHRVNTVILRDTSTDEIDVIYANPATTGTKQVQFEGKGLEEFKTAHAPYVLW